MAQDSALLSQIDTRVVLQYNVVHGCGIDQCFEKISLAVDDCP